MLSERRAGRPPDSRRDGGATETGYCFFFPNSPPKLPNALFLPPGMRPLI